MNSGSSNQVQETPQELQAAKNDLALYNYSEQTYKPYIEKYISQTTNNASSKMQEGAAKGQVNAEVMKGLTEATRNPNATNPVAVTKAAEGAGKIDATAQNTAAEKVKNRQLGERQNIIDIGRGEQTQVQQAQDSIAAQSIKDEIQNVQSNMKTQGVYENAVGSVVGAGVAGYNRKLASPDDIYDPLGTDYGRANK